MNPHRQCPTPGEVDDSPSGRDLDALREDHRKALRALQERVKELNCLYSITRLAQREDLSTLELAKGIAQVLRNSWQYPDIACARVMAEGVEFRTTPYEATPWVQTAPVPVQGGETGMVEVRYLRPCPESPESDEGPFLREERHLIDAVGELLGQILEARRAKAQVEQLSRELIKAQESERQRIARELHDKAAQDLSLLKIELETLHVQHEPLPRGLQSHVTRLVAQTTAIIGEIRNISYALLPPDLELLGLASAAFRLCEEFEVRHAVAMEFSADGMSTLRLDFETQINLYRILQEALANIRKHSCATHARVRLVASHPCVILRIEDNGVGFDQAAPPTFGPDGRRRLGLLSMRERARLLGGVFRLRTEPGKGVRLMVEAPAKTRNTP
jgi:signal transduction histidine kinase